MTDGVASAQDPLDAAAEPAVGAVDEPGRRVRRRRRAASRPAGPPTPDRGRPDDGPGHAADGYDEAPAPLRPDAGPVAGPDPVVAVDPVERSDRRREKKRRNRSERLAAEAAAAAAAAPPLPARTRRPQSDRGMHALEGNRATQLPSTEAMRAREWAAPGPDDLAAAEAELVIVRRHYRPPEPLPTKKQASGQNSRTPAERRRPRG